MAIKVNNSVEVIDGVVKSKAELINNLEELKDGAYHVLVFDKIQNRSLPQLKFLNGVVLKTISDNLPDHPPVEALYSFFEEQFAPTLSCEINGEFYEYKNLKRSKSIEMDKVIDQIVHYAKSQWNIDVMSQKELRHPDALMPYADAYTEQWREFI